MEYVETQILKMPSLTLVHVWINKFKAPLQTLAPVSINEFKLL